MKKYNFIKLLLVVVLASCSLSPALAQDIGAIIVDKAQTDIEFEYYCQNQQTGQALYAKDVICNGQELFWVGDDNNEQIKSFDVTVQVNDDNSIDVTESIVYQTGAQEEKRGILRDIRTKSAQNRNMQISDISVTDDNGAPHTFSVNESLDITTIRIGDPEVYFSGQKTYIIKYHATRAASIFKDFDEIYWNVTGNEWTYPIISASAKIILPGQTEELHHNCYQGFMGSVETCQQTASSTTFMSTTNLLPGEGLTVGVAFPKGVIKTVYTWQDNWNLLVDYWAEKIFLVIFMALLFCVYVSIPLAIIILILRIRRFINAMHQAGNTFFKSNIVYAPEYLPNDKISPLLAFSLIKNGADITDDAIASEIMHLVVKKYLKLHIKKDESYELELLKEYDDLEEYQRILITSLFSEDASKIAKVGDRVDVSEINENITSNEPIRLGSHVFEGQNSQNRLSLLSTLIKKLASTRNYYDSTLEQVKPLMLLHGTWFKILLAIFMLSMFYVFGPSIGMLNLFLIILVSIIFGLKTRLLIQKSDSGREAYAYVAGLKRYIQSAERERIIFNNAPEKTPEHFEKLLPFAMVFGSVDIWLKELDSMKFNTADLSNTALAGLGSTSLKSLSDNLATSYSPASTSSGSSYSSSSSSSGSSGGGSSGGGGGGGGGSSW